MTTIKIATITVTNVYLVPAIVHLICAATLKACVTARLSF